MIVRFLYANGFKMDKTLASIKEHTTWRETTLPVKVDADLLKFLVNILKAFSVMLLRIRDYCTSTEETTSSDLSLFSMCIN